MLARLAAGLEGRYTIDREIGAGGMATVYLARDTRHKRNVALKVLNPELGAVLGAERFLAEIQVTANLQHPNLLPLFDSGEVDGFLFYVMPFVEGESLRARLEREKQLPVDETIRIATAIAGALGYAHRHSVVHRDLKPENILMHEGQPLIADFGIALAVSNAGGARITQTGLSLGTPQYMSPEQATGDRTVDGRTDIYSLGAMTYEMLVGDPPHVASTSQAIIAKLLTERPASIRSSRPSVPQHVDAAVGKALEKLAADRFATARELADALEGRSAVIPSSSSYKQEAPVIVPRNRPRAREIAAWAMVAGLGALLAWQLSRPSPVERSQVVRANFDVPGGVRINDVIPGTTIAVSPRGDMIAFTSTTLAGYRVYVRKFNEIAPRAIADVAGRNLTFSPDGKWIAFTEGNSLQKVSVDGGELVTIGVTGGAVPYGLAWSESGTIYIGSFSGLWAIPATGGNATHVAPDANSGLLGRRWPMFLPGEKAIVFASGNSSTFTTSRLAVLSLDDNRIEEFPHLMSMPLGLMHGYLVYVSPAGSVMGIRFDGNRAVGEPIQLEEGLLVDPTTGAKASLSASGTLAYMRGRAQFQPMLFRAGSDSGTALIPEPGIFQNPRFSPEGDRLAVTLFGANTPDIWIYNLRLNTFTRLTTEGLNLRPEWSADGRHVVFISTRNNITGVWRQPADGSGPAELIYKPEIEPFEALMSPDMKWLLFRTSPGARYPRDILAVPLEGEKKVVPVVTGPATESQPRLSYDGKWLAYQSSESGRFQVYVRPFPESGARIQVSDNGGTEPLWGRDGRTLFYRGALGEVIQVAVTTGESFSIGARSVALRGDYLTDASHANYDVARDGRFLMLKRAGAESQTVVVHNWGMELKEKTAAR
jgi:serine/threonine-protein kinase